MLCNQMLSVGHVPSDWLRAVIVAVFKKGVAGKLQNYRPISLTCVTVVYPAKFLKELFRRKFTLTWLL